MQVSSVSGIQSSIQHSSGANIFTQMQAERSTDGGEFVPSSQFVVPTSTHQAKFNDGASGFYTSSISSSITGPDSKGIVSQSTQPMITHTEKIPTSATTRPLNHSQLLATFTPSEWKLPTGISHSVIETTAAAVIVAIFGMLVILTIIIAVCW